MLSYIRTLIRLEGLPRSMQMAIYVLIGISIGMAGLLIRASRAMSYLNKEPETCANCHVMTDAYASWQRGSHGTVAVCTDCHLPHQNIVAMNRFKATDGMKHSAIFTAGAEPQVIELSHEAVPVIQQNCLRCHGSSFSMIRLAGSEERTCWDCHTGIHIYVRSLSSSDAVLRPKLPPAGINRKPKGSDR